MFKFFLFELDQVELVDQLLLEVREGGVIFVLREYFVEAGLTSVLKLDVVFFDE